MEEKEFFSRYSKYLWVGLGVFALIACTFFFKERNEGEKSKSALLDFRDKCELLPTLASRASIPLETFTTLESILLRHPELHPLLDMPLALTLCSKGDKKGTSFAQAQLNRSKKLPLNPLIFEFSEISLLIENGEKERALEKAKILESKLEKMGEFARLRAFNLLRIALLEKKSQVFEKAKELPESKNFLLLLSEGSCEFKDLFSKT